MRTTQDGSQLALEARRRIVIINVDVEGDVVTIGEDSVEDVIHGCCMRGKRPRQEGVVPALEHMEMLLHNAVLRACTASIIELVDVKMLMCLREDGKDALPHPAGVICLRSAWSEVVLAAGTGKWIHATLSKRGFSTSDINTDRARRPA